MRKQTRLNDRERELWIMNDEALYKWRYRSSLPMREFIKLHRAEIDNCILAVLDRNPKA